MASKAGWFRRLTTPKSTTIGPQKTDSQPVTPSVSSDHLDNTQSIKLPFPHSHCLCLLVVFGIGFRYKKDSVMEVTEEEYKRCNSTQPSFFSNTGNTVFQLGRSGTFYFISGAYGHCERGQRMIVKVMAEDESSSSSHSEKSSAVMAPISSLGFLKFVSAPMALSILF